MSLFMGDQAWNKFGALSSNPNYFNFNATATRDTIAQVLPREFASVIAALSSHTILFDWLLLAFMRWMYDMYYSISSSRFWLYDKFFQMISFEVEFNNNDESHKWLMTWLSKQPAFANSRKIAFTRLSYGIHSSALGRHAPVNARINAMTYLPDSQMPYKCWFRWHYLTIDYSNTTFDTSYAYGHGAPPISSGSAMKIWYIAPLPHSRAIILELLEEARKVYNSTVVTQTHIYTAQGGGGGPWGGGVSNWVLSSSSPKRSFDSIILNPAVKNLLLRDAFNFMSSQDWYSSRNVPYRRGYLLYGEPGSGKTSFISAIAGELELDIYVVSLSEPGMSDQQLAKLFSTLPGHCIALLEDIDAAFTTSLNRDAPVQPVEPPIWPIYPEPGKPLVSLSGLLNALDGIGAQEGRILFATTNKYDSLDPALTRPGRMDIHIEFKLAAKYQAHDLFKRFFDPSHDRIDQSQSDKPGEDKLDDGIHTKEDGAIDPLSHPPILLSSDVDGDTGPTPPPTPPYTPNVKFVGRLHNVRVPRLSERRLEELAEAFADAIPDFKISMASLQGYLMLHKTTPVAAVEGAPAWVEETLRAATLGKFNEFPKAQRGLRKSGQPMPRRRGGATFNPSFTSMSRPFNGGYISD